MAKAIHKYVFGLPQHIWDRLSEDAREKKKTRVAVLRSILAKHYRLPDVLHEQDTCPECGKPVSRSGATHTACATAAMLRGD